MKKHILALLAISLVLAACAPQQPQAKPQPLAQQGFDLHIDAKRHVESDREFVVHHHCKKFKAGHAECQLYDSDDAEARLIGIEVVIGKELYDSLPQEEKGRWHHHAEEISRKEVGVTLPGLSEDEAAKVAEMLGPTYGKVYIIWEPNEAVPLAQPKVVAV